MGMAVPWLLGSRIRRYVNRFCPGTQGSPTHHLGPSPQPVRALCGTHVTNYEGAKALQRAVVGLVGRIGAEMSPGDEVFPRSVRPFRTTAESEGAADTRVRRIDVIRPSVPSLGRIVHECHIPSEATYSDGDVVVSCIRCGA